VTNVTKIALEEQRGTSAVPEGRPPRRLASQWYKNAEGVLEIRWVVEVELHERRLPRHVGSVKMAGQDAVNAIVERRSHDRDEMTAEVGETFRGIAIDGFGGSHRA